MTDTPATWPIARAWDAGAHPRAPAGGPAGGQFAAGSSGAAPTNAKPVGEGETGKRVSDLQKRLNALGMKPPLKVDGKFGPKTLAAVRAFQKTHGLRVDGLVGPKTTAALRHKAPAHHAGHPSGKAPVKTARPAPAAHSAKASRALAHEPLGKPGGPGLFHHKGMQLPAFVQHIARDLMTERGMPESEAIATAVAQCKKWAAGGEGVKPETRAKAAAAVAEWERLKAGANATRSIPMTELMRIYPLEDIHILTRAEGDGTGRVVEAYATVFDQEAEIHDHQGHYTEVIDRAAFDQVLRHISGARGGLAANVKVLYNHGKTIGGAEAPEFQLPLGKPLDVRPEARGLLTRTEYDTSDPFTERILSKIHAGTITAQSFVGGIMRSSPELPGPGSKYRGRNGALTKVRRMVLGLREYGPVLFPAYSGAEILGVRMSIPGAVLDEEIEDAADSTEVDEYGSDDEELVAAGTREEVHTTRHHQHALYALRSRELREQEGMVF